VHWSSSLLGHASSLSALMGGGLSTLALVCDDGPIPGPLNIASSTLSSEAGIRYLPAPLNTKENIAEAGGQIPVHSTESGEDSQTSRPTRMITGFVMTAIQVSRLVMGNCWSQ
jgi:hypothetical protein